MTSLRVNPPPPKGDGMPILPDTDFGEIDAERERERWLMERLEQIKKIRSKPIWLQPPEVVLSRGAKGRPTLVQTPYGQLAIDYADNWTPPQLTAPQPKVESKPSLGPPEVKLDVGRFTKPDVVVPKIEYGAVGSVSITNTPPRLDLQIAGPKLTGLPGAISIFKFEELSKPLPEPATVYFAPEPKPWPPTQPPNTQKPPVKIEPPPVTLPPPPPPKPNFEVVLSRDSKGRPTLVQTPYGQLAIDYADNWPPPPQIKLPNEPPAPRLPPTDFKISEPHPPVKIDVVAPKTTLELPAWLRHEPRFEKPDVVVPKTVKFDEFPIRVNVEPPRISLQMPEPRFEIGSARPVKPSPPNTQKPPVKIEPPPVTPPPPPPPPPKPDFEVVLSRDSKDRPTLVQTPWGQVAIDYADWWQRPPPPPPPTALEDRLEEALRRVEQQRERERQLAERLETVKTKLPNHIRALPEVTPQLPKKKPTPLPTKA